MPDNAGSAQLSDVQLYFTPMEKRILAVLNDGDLHKRDELMLCLEDSLANPDNLHAHLKNIRKKLLTISQTICCVVLGRRRFYRRMILFVPLPDTEQDDLPS